MPIVVPPVLRRGREPPLCRDNVFVFSLFGWYCRGSLNTHHPSSSHPPMLQSAWLVISASFCVRGHLSFLSLLPANNAAGTTNIRYYSGSTLLVDHKRLRPRITFRITYFRPQLSTCNWFKKESKTRVRADRKTGFSLHDVLAIKENIGSLDVVRRTCQLSSGLFASPSHLGDST
jgi:hypothetical protein